MFIVSLTNGVKLVEGQGDIETWDDVPKDDKIQGVTLTDGRHLIETLTGFDYYVVCQEADLTATVEVLLPGTDKSEVKLVPSNAGARVKAQILYGIRSNKVERQLVEVIGNGIRDDIQDLFTEEFIGKNLLLVTAYHWNTKYVVEKVKRLLAHMKAREVVKITLGCKKEYLNSEGCNQAEDRWRVGRGVSESDYTKDNILKFISPAHLKPGEEEEVANNNE